MTCKASFVGNACHVEKPHNGPGRDDDPSDWHGTCFRTEGGMHIELRWRATPVSEMEG